MPFPAKEATVQRKDSRPDFKVSDFHPPSFLTLMETDELSGNKMLGQCLKLSESRLNMITGSLNRHHRQRFEHISE